MKRLFPFLSALLVATALSAATDQLRDVQSELKNEGFFYGEVDGKPSEELNAAVRRYQIRNGLDVTGDLSPSTLSALGLGPAPSAPAQPAQPPVARANPAPKPPVNLRREETTQDTDRRALTQEPPIRHAPGDRAIVPPPAPLDDEPTANPAPGGAYVELFAGTPYATAPRAVQQQTVLRAQSLLASRGLYRDALDGEAGPATEEAVLAFQRNQRLPLTGRLDLQTLAQLRLLPGRGQGNPPSSTLNSSTNRRVIRGIWVE